MTGRTGIREPGFLHLSTHHPLSQLLNHLQTTLQPTLHHPNSLTNKQQQHVCQHRKRHRRPQGQPQQPQFVSSLPISCHILTYSDTSEESKQHSREVLQNAENGGEVEAASSSGGDKNPNNVAGGLKATLNNPNTSDEAKESAKERLNDM
jgi:hypothetical protein